MIRTELCNLLGIQYPIIQAGMGPFDTTDLAAAVSNAGAMGIISHYALDADQAAKMAEAIRKVKGMTKGHFGANVRVAARYSQAEEVLEAIFRERRNDEDLYNQMNLLITSAGDC